MLRASRDDNSVEGGGSSCEESSSVDENDGMIANGSMDGDDDKAKLHKRWKRVASRMTKLDKDNMKTIALLALVVMVFLRLGQTTNNSSSPPTSSTMHTKSLRAHGPDGNEGGSSRATKSKHGAPIDEDEDTSDPTANTGSSNNLLSGGNGGGYLANGGGFGLMGGNTQFGGMQQQNFMQPGLMQQQGLATQQVLLQQQQQQQAAAMMQQQQQQQVLLQQQAQTQLEEQMRLQQEAFQKQQEAIMLQQQQQQQQLMLQQMQNPQQQPMGVGMLGGQQQRNGAFNMANFGGLQQQQPGWTPPGGGANSLLSNNQFMGQAGMPQQQMGQLAQFGGGMGATTPDTFGAAGLMAGTTGAAAADPMAQAVASTSAGASGAAADPMAQATVSVGAAAAADPVAQATETAGAADPVAQAAGSVPADPAGAGRPSDADMAQVAAEIPLNDLANFRDSWEPYNEKDIPIYFHIPKAGGSTVKDVIGSCLRMVMASEFGVTDGHDKDTEIAIVYPKVPGGTGSEDRSPFINVDTTSVAGIERAAKMGFADSGLAGCVVTPFLYESNALFTPTARGRLFAVFRHPVDRAVSMFYYIQVATWEPSYMPELQSWTLEQYATSTVIENNWMTRFLSNQLSGDLDDSHLKIAMEVIRRKFMVGLMNQLPASMTRFEKFYRLKYHVNPTNQEACRERLTSGGANSNSKNKKEKPKNGEPLWDLIAAQNLFDIRLYEYIEALFVEQEAFVADIPDDFRNIDATCCKCDPPTFPLEGFACPKKVLNAA